MDHPPIHQDCELFRYEAVCGPCWKFRNANTPISFSEKDQHERQMIASFHALLWIESAENEIATEKGDMSKLGSGSAFDQASKNADAWKAWAKK